MRSSGERRRPRPGNVSSRRVMKRSGMRRDPGGDVNHPVLPEGHPFRRMVLYRAARDDAHRPGA